MEVIIATLIIFLGAYIQTALGFGLAIVAAPILFLLDPLYVPAPITMSALTLSLVMALSHWESISFSGLKFAIGGPPMALLLQHEKSTYIRANMSAFFCASCLMSLVMLLVIGKLDQSHIFLFLPLIPATLIGYWLAMKTVRKISHNSLRYSSLALCMLAGSMTVASYWW